MISMMSPFLEIKFSDGVGNVVELAYTLASPTITEVAAHMRYALLGMGFSNEQVQEVFCCEE